MRNIVIIFMFVFVAGCISHRETDYNSGKQVEVLKEVQNRSIDSSTIRSIIAPFKPDRIITVGGAGADLKGFTSEAIQTAIDAIRVEGGRGTVILLQGEFEVIAPVRLYSNITLKGSGEKTILKKCKGYSSPFAVDADYGELQVTVQDASGFKPGMGVAIFDEDQRYGWDLTTAKITDIKGNTLFIDEFLVRDYRSDKKGTVSNACSVISAVEAENIKIADLVVDGSAGSNDMIDGCRAGGIYLHKVRNAVIENVTVKNFNSDGISWQITEHVTVRNCEIYGCTNSGLHPGTGSPYTVIEGNRSHDNGGYGLFVCWRVRYGIVRDNIFYRNGRNGISTGHKDTDMLFSGNHIYENGSDGISLRGETDLNAPHRSVFRNNIIENNGTREKGYGIGIYSKAEDVVIENNIIRNTGNNKQIAAIYLSANSLPVKVENNEFSGHSAGDIISDQK